MLFTLLIKCRLIVLCSFASSSDAQKHYITIQNTGNVDVNVTLAVYGTVCQYYNVTTQTWRTNGCEPSVESTVDQSVCTCDHMTMFGASALVSPADVNFRDIPVSGVFDGCIFLPLPAAATA